MIPWTVAHQAPLSMEFSRPEYWSDLPFPFQGIFLTQGSNPGLLYYRQILSLSEPRGKPLPGGATPNFVPERFLSIPWGFPGGSVVKNPPASAGDTSLIPDQGRSHMTRRNKAHGPQQLSLCTPTTEAHMRESLCCETRKATAMRSPHTTTSE